mmetsp:Transcript_90182/g.215394  ORF Transcript_90182/g.215394 Transcript_90182/m.215394 type:complete len:294 (+) Transcript_90182:2894-3775(+)
MVDGMLEVCQGVGPGSSANQSLSFTAAQEANVLHHVSNALLIWILVNAAHMQLDVSLEAFRWHSIAKHHVSQSVRKHPTTHTRVRRQQLLLQIWWAFWPLHEAALRCFPMRLPVEQAQVLDLVWKCCLRNYRLCWLCVLDILQSGGLLHDLDLRGFLDWDLARYQQLQSGVRHPLGTIPNAECTSNRRRIQRRIRNKRPPIGASICMGRKCPLVGFIVEQIDGLAVGGQPELHVHRPPVALMLLLLVLAAEWLPNRHSGAYPNSNCIWVAIVFASVTRQVFGKKILDVVQKAR